MKRKAFRITLLLSFLPYIGILLYGLYSAIFGISAFFSTAYGWDGFFWAVLGSAFVLTAVPVLPACLIFQLCSLVKWISTKAGATRKVSILITSVIGILLGIAALMLALSLAQYLF